MGIHSVASGIIAPPSLGTTAPSADEPVSTTSTLPEAPTDSFVGTVAGSLWSLGRSLVGGITAPTNIPGAQPPTLAADAKALRSFALDLVKASGTQGDEHARAQAIRLAMAEHPEVVLWICEGRDVAQLAQAADLPTLPDGANPVLAVLPQLGSGMQNAWSTLESYSALTYSLSAANDYYNAMPEGSLFAAVEAMSAGVGAAMVRRMGRQAVVSLAARVAREQAQTKYAAMTAEDRLALLEYVPDSVCGSVSSQIDTAIIDAKISESDEVKMMLDPDQGFDLENVPPAFRAFFENVLTQYFDKLPIEDKRRIAVGLLELPPGTSDEDKLAAILNNSGPAMQKLFQLFGDDVKSEKVGKVMAALKSQIKPFDSHIARATIERDLNGEIEDIFSSFRDKPLAAASVGQVHAATLKDSGEDVIVKVMRPGIRERARRELKLLKELAPGGGTRKIVDRLESSLMDELDFTLEAANMKAGEVYWKPQKGVFPIGLAGDFETTQDVLVMERAYENPIDKFHGKSLPLKSEALATFTELWYDNALFGDGFFHGDLHAGNIFFNPEPLPGYAPYGRDYQLTLIDFGACGKLSKLERRGVLSLILGAATSSPEIVTRALCDLCEITEDQNEALQNYSADVFKSGVSTSVACNDIVNKAIELEIGLPKNFVLYNRGRAFLENQIRDTNKELDVWDKEGNVKRENPEKIFRNLMVWRLGQDLVKSALHIQSSEDAYLDPETVTQIVDKYLPADEGYDSDYDFMF
jgi:predicted unusual protein kinase regulating ubiquinone biosynthesis (AarF/ABC1/UbiB family)